MINSFDVLNREMPIHLPTQSSAVGDTNKYEGKDNPGVPWYYRRQKPKQVEKKKEQPRGDHKVDVIA